MPKAAVDVGIMDPPMKDVMGVVNEVLANEGAPNDPPVIEEDFAQPLHTENAQSKVRISIFLIYLTFIVIYLKHLPNYRFVLRMKNSQRPPSR